MKKSIYPTLALVILLIGCSSSDSNVNTTIDYKEEMRNFVIGISGYAKNLNPNFAIIPQNGIEIVTKNGQADGELATNYLNAIDGNGQEDLLYGYDNDDVATQSSTTNYLKSYLNISKNAGNKILVTDYCSTHSKMDNSYTLNAASNYISFSANERGLNTIPNYPTIIHNENNSVVTNLSQAQNFIFLK